MARFEGKGSLKRWEGAAGLLMGVSVKELCEAVSAGKVWCLASGVEPPFDVLHA